MLPIIKQHIEQLLVQAGISGVISLSPPPTSDMGDLAFGCFQIAKEQGKNPAEVAAAIVSEIKIQADSLVAEVKAFGPYVNFYLHTGKLAALVVGEIEKENIGSNMFGNGKKVMIEYPSQNTHKEFHIGHLRNVCIGNTLVRLYEKNGYSIQPVNYINDFGAHVVKCLWGIQHFHAGKVPSENVQKWLGEVYAEASMYVKEHPEVQAEINTLQTALEARDPSIWELFITTRDASLAGFTHIHDELGIRHGRLFLESEVKDRGQAIVDELVKKGIAKEGEKGAIIIDLTEEKLDIALLRKGTGAGLYMTSDLALAEEKFAAFDVEESINITGIEQNFYFKQLFRVLDLFGFKNKMTHIGYGLVTLPSGKMSSRAGNVILYEDLRDQMYARLLGETSSRHPDWHKDQIELTAKKLTMAALKFTMDQHEANKNIVFDFEQAVSFEGFSGPYILYVVARINSLLKKGNGDIRRVSDYTCLVEPEEKQVLLLLAEYGNVIEKALAQYNPSTITRYCFDLAQTFNNFYNTHKIILEDNPELSNARLMLCHAVKEVLTDALSVLTIETVEEM